MLIEKIKQEKFIGIFREKENIIENTIAASYEGGLKIFELTFSIPNVQKWVLYTKEKYKDVMVGVGTVLNKEDAEKVIKNGADFLVSPIFSRDVHNVCLENNIPYFPGFMTFQEMFEARELGIKHLKLFPASQMGEGYIKALNSLFPDIQIMATGGVNVKNAKSWLDAGAFSVGIGSEISKLANQEKFSDITSLIKDLKEILSV